MLRGLSHANPKPAQPTIPVVVGGHTASAAKRAVILGHGWYGFMRNPEATKADLANEAGGRDNVSVVVVRVSSAAELQPT